MNKSMPLDNPIDYYRVGKLEGKQEILDKLNQWVQGRRDIFHDCIIDFIDDNTPPKGGE